MLRLAIFFCLLSAISAVLGGSVVSVVAAGIANFLFVTFLLMCGLCIILAGRLMRTFP